MMKKELLQNGGLGFVPLLARKAFMAEFEDRSLGNDENPQDSSRQSPPQTGQELAPVADSSAAAITSDAEESAPALAFPVVALGASAGGLEAFTRILRNLPTNTGMAFLLIQHLAPQHASQLSELLSRVTSMPVSEVQEGTPVRPDQIFVIPPNKLMTISQGVLKLTARAENSGVPMPIDHFFRSLARDQKGGAIAVVLSGTDHDGALGLQAIREEGGIAIAQSEGSAKFAGMPQNAARAGTVDLILPPEEIAKELGRIGRLRSSYIPAHGEPDANHGSDDHHLSAILTQLRKSTGIDFRGYKLGTLRRRIARRMVLKQHTQLAEYAAYLASNGPELKALFEDILIGVTSFFRDADTFLSLEKQILPAMLKDRSADVPLRVWVPGCSTGEEVYSIAMCLIEAVSKFPSPLPIQVFGTDLSERALSVARTAVYQEHQLVYLSEDRRRQFFVPVPTGYQIEKSVRELCVFARQNVCVDPPYSRLDLISCRNLLIYLAAALQRNVIATFHYALQPGGYLLLGGSENLRGFPELFSIVDKQHKFFQRSVIQNASLAMIGRGFVKERSTVMPPLRINPNPRSSKVDFEKAAERIVLRDYSPSWVVADESFEIIHTSGDTGPFLQLPTGAPTFDLLRMARDNIRGELRKLLTTARNENLFSQLSVIREETSNQTRKIDLRVRRLSGEISGMPCFLVVFSYQAERPDERHGNEPTPSNFDDRTNHALQTEMLRDEVAFTSQRLQAIIDERDTANQELTSAYEEIQSSNEELQSINEELETAKEELQSGNEELSTLNDELQNRNQELSRLSDDLSNLMSSTTIPILLLDKELRIRRMTPVTQAVLGIRPADLGRPIGDIRMSLSGENLESLAQGVLATLAPCELDLQDREGRWRELRMRPYRTADNRIDGVVIVLVDIDQLRHAKFEATVALEFAESVIQAVPSPLLVLQGNLQIRLANRVFYEEYGLQPADVENHSFLELSRAQWDMPGLRDALTDVLRNRETNRKIECERDFAGKGKITLCVYLRPIQSDGEKLILVVLEDITERKDASRILVARQEELKSSVAAGTAALRETETALFRSHEELRELAASLLNAQESERRRISRELHDDLSQKVAKLQFDIETLEQKLPFSNPELARQSLLSVRDQTGTLANDLRRVAHGLHPSSLDHLGLRVALQSYIEEFSRSIAIPVQFNSSEIPREIPMEIAICLYRIVQEALRNVGKHAPNATVEIALSGSPQELHLSIRDDGEGFDMSALRSTKGLGFISMQERVRLIQGHFSLSTQPGAGVHISVDVPLDPGTV